MQSIQDDAMAQAILGAIRKGPKSDSQLLGLFQRNRNAEEIDTVLSRLRQAKLIDFTTEATTGKLKRRAERIWRPYEKSNEESAQPGKRRIFCSLRFPSLAIGKSVRFENGFLETADTELQETIERSGEYNLSIHDVSAVIRREMPLTAGKRVYLSSDPCLALSDHTQYHVRFRRVADGLGIFSSDIPDCHRMIEESGLLKTGAVRQVPASLLTDFADGSVG